MLVIERQSAKSFSIAAILAATTQLFPTTYSYAQTGATSKASQVVAAALTNPDSRSCEVWYFGALGSKCIKFGPGTLASRYAGAMGNQAPNCPTIRTNQVASAVTPPAGGATCFQFVVNGAVTMPVNVALPPNTSGIAELFVIYPNGAGFKLQEARIGTPLALNFATSNAQRIGLVVRTLTGPGGQNMNIGVNYAAPAAPTQPNSTVQDATSVQMNRGVNAMIGTQGTSEGYYFYPLPSGESRANINVAFTANQFAGVRIAQLLAPNVYKLGEETILPGNWSGETKGWVSPYTNTSDTTTPHGFLVRVSGKNVAQLVDESYFLRVSGGRNYITQTVVSSDRMTSSDALLGSVQAINYLTIGAKIKDAAGSLVPNEPVSFEFVPNVDSNTSQTLSGVTDEYGFVTVTGMLPACSGKTYPKIFESLTGLPADRLAGQAQYGRVTIKVAGATPPSGFRNSIDIPFTRICRKP